METLTPHFEVARIKKIAHMDWLLLVEENTILIMRRGAKKQKTRIIYELWKKFTVFKTSERKYDARGFG